MFRGQTPVLGEARKRTRVTSAPQRAPHISIPESDHKRGTRPRQSGILCRFEGQVSPPAAVAHPADRPAWCPDPAIGPGGASGDSSIHGRCLAADDRRQRLSGSAGTAACSTTCTGHAAACLTSTGAVAVEPGAARPGSDPPGAGFLAAAPGPDHVGASADRRRLTLSGLPLPPYLIQFRSSK